MSISDDKQILSSMPLFCTLRNLGVMHSVMHSAVNLYSVLHFTKQLPVSWIWNNLSPGEKSSVHVQKDAGKYSKIN